METLNRPPRWRAQVAATPMLPPLTLPQAPAPMWELRFWCDGREFVAMARGRNAHAAVAEAQIELAYRFPDFDADSARLAAAVQVGA